MNRQGKSSIKNKRKKNKKKNQDANGAGRNDQAIQPQVQDGRQEQYARTYDTKPEQVHVQQKGQQHINLGQPNKDKNKETNQAEVGKSAYFNQGILNAESLQAKEIQEMKQTVSDEMDKVANLLVEQMREINKSQQTFDLRVFGSSEMNPDERAKETQKAILYLAEKMRLRGKCAPQTLLDKQEERLQEICFRYDELSKLLQRLEDLEGGETTHNTKDAHAKPLAARDEITGKECKETFLKTCRPKIIEQPCHPPSKHNEEQSTPPTNFKTTQNVPGKIYPSEKVLGGSHHGAASIGDGNLDDEVLLRSSPKNEDDKSNASQQQLSSDDSNEFLAFQAFAAPMKFLRRVKKKVGNLFFSQKKEKVKDNCIEANGDNIDLEDRAVALGGTGPVLPQPVQRAFTELQNDTAHGNASNKKGFEQLLVTPEVRASLTTKTTMAQGREDKETKGRPSTGFTTGFKAAEIGIAGKNADNKNVPLKQTSNLQTPQHIGLEGIKVKTAAEVKQMGDEGRSQGAAPNKNNNIQSVAVKQKVVSAASQSGVKQMSHLEKRDALSKSATPLPTIPEQNTKQTAAPGVKVAGKVNLPAVNLGPNLTPQASPNVRVKHQNASVASASPKNFPGKAAVPTKAVCVSSSSNTASSVASSARVQSKDQKSPQPQPRLVPQKEPRKDAISKTTAHFVATKGKVLEEKTVNSPGKPSQEPIDATAQVAVAKKKTSPTPSFHQQGTSTKGSDIGSASNKQENHADGCKSAQGILKKEKPTSSRVSQIAASLPPSSKVNPVVNHTSVAVQEVRSSNNEADTKQDSTQYVSSPCERRILKARRRITFEEDNKPEATGSAELPAIGEEVDYETVMPEEFEQAVAEAMDDERFSEESSSKEKQSNRSIYSRSYAPLQDIPESSALEIQVSATQETMQAGRKKKNRGKYAISFVNPRKSINCCCEYNCHYCVPAWEWDKVVANQRKKR